MTSAINYTNIDATFPVAGQDNSSQGFRDNFQNIKTNFQYASTEISALQANAVLAKIEPARLFVCPAITALACSAEISVAAY